MSSLPFPVVPAGPVNSPTWRKGAEREREGGKGEWKVCRCDRSGRCGGGEGGFRRSG